MKSQKERIMKLGFPAILHGLYVLKKRHFFFLSLSLFDSSNFYVPTTVEDLGALELPQTSRVLHQRSNNSDARAILVSSGVKPGELIRNFVTLILPLGYDLAG